MSTTESTSDSIYAALEAELDVERIDWEPEQAGERIVGEVKAIEYVSLDSGRVMGVLTLATPSGALARVAAGAKQLKGQLETAKVQPGDALAIKYEGKKTGRNGGREFNSYVVATQAVGDRRPEDVFKVPEETDDLLPGAAEADPWAGQAEQTGPGF